jgi:hypothetical protein
VSPGCVCAVPYRGTLFFRSPSFSDLSNGSYWGQLETGIRAKFRSLSVPVDSVALHDPSVNSVNNLQLALEVFPSGKTQFSEQDISDIGFILSNQTYKPPSVFGPYYFLGQPYSFANGNNKIIHFHSRKESSYTSCCFFYYLLLFFHGRSGANTFQIEGEQPLTSDRRSLGGWSGSCCNSSCSCYHRRKEEEETKAERREEPVFWFVLRSTVPLLPFCLYLVHSFSVVLVTDRSRVLSIM